MTCGDSPPDSTRDSNNEPDTDSDADSETSTIVYGHEGFETYQTRIRDLLRALRGPNVAAAAEIERLRGGSFNRIIGVSLPSAGDKLILRVPRFEHVDVAIHSGVLRSLRDKLPVPEVVEYDTGTDSALGEPYLLTRRIEGVDLHSVLDTMKIVDRCTMAVQIARLIATIHAVPVPFGIGPLSVDNAEKLCLGHFRNDDANDIADEDGNTTDHHTVHYGSTLQKLPEFIQMRIMNIRASALRRSPDNTYIPKLCDDLEHASQSLLRGVQLTNQNVLFHRDYGCSKYSRYVHCR